MKALLFFLSFLLSIHVQATVRTVSNVPSTLAQFNTIQAAINASNSGDTILVHGSLVHYAGFTLANKRLVLIGPGFSPNVQPTHAAIINSNITLTGAATKKTVIQGFYCFTGTLSLAAGVDSVYIMRNYLYNVDLIGGGGTLTGTTFRNNYISAQVATHPGSFHHNLLFENNIFESTNCITNFTNGGSTNILFNHNLFFAHDGIPNSVFNGLAQALLTNNIFVERNFNSTVYFCTFTNNITFNCSPNDPWIANGNIDGGGNVINMDPMMVDQAAVNDGSANVINNYTIASGPANNSGSDGKDMGLLYDTTGELNWIRGRNARMPSVVSMTIANPVLAAGGTLNITVQARKNE